ncbi:MAG: hypothetical protein ACHREM_01550 [Polyangiales bacterium]
MTIRALVQQAIHKALDDLNEIIERKLVAMFDDDVEPPARSKQTVRRLRAAPSKARASIEKPPTKRASRKPPTKPKSATAKPARDAAELRDRILATLDVVSAPMSRSQLIAAIEVRPSEEPRFGHAIGLLRADKLIVLEGERRNAVYRCATIGEASAPSERSL